MTALVLGANTVLADSTCLVTLSGALAFGRQIGCVWLATDSSRQAVTSPAYLHEDKPWAQVVSSNGHDTPHAIGWRLDLTQAFATGASSLQLVVYAYETPDYGAPAVELDALQVKVSAGADDIRYAFAAHERHVKASRILEIYQRHGQYKCRALADHSMQGLAVFAQHLGISLNARAPTGTSDHTAPSRPQAGETWTGTAFAIDAYHLLTCHHVIEHANLIGLRQAGLPDCQAYVVLSDAGSDCALLKVSTPMTHWLRLRETRCDLLGESVTTLGYPMSGLGGQLQVTQGNIAGLRGIGNDIRFLQFTAPIQSGSSGSPLLLPTGEVVGMVTHGIINEIAQNMNYAVKYQLLSALLASAGLDAPPTFSSQPIEQRLSAPQLAKQSQHALWLVGCQA